MNCGVCSHRKVCRCFPNPEEYCSDFEPERPHGEWEKESAIDYLTEIGWLPEHDRILTERPHGEWIYHKEWECDGECAFECSKCGMGTDVDYNFCPNCGANMRGETK